MRYLGPRKGLIQPVFTGSFHFRRDWRTVGTQLAFSYPRTSEIINDLEAKRGPGPRWGAVVLLRQRVVMKRLKNTFDTGLGFEALAQIIIREEERHRK